MSYNKRGQEGVTLTTLILIVIGVVVAVVIILGATGALNTIFSKKDALPGNLEAVTQSCIVSARNNLIADYCYTYKKIGDNEFVNCEDPRIKSSLDQQSITAIDCSKDNKPELRVSARYSACKPLSASAWSNAIFNNNPALKCPTCTELGANGETPQAGACPAGKVKYEGAFPELNSQICCK